MKYSIDIAIPVLNEEETLEANINKLLGYISKSLASLYDIKIIICDNGSSDKTLAISKRLSAKYTKQVKALHLDKPGVGMALQHAWENSSADVIGYMDLDFSTDLKHLDEALMIVTSPEYDILYGTRLHKKSKVIGRTIVREIISRVFNYLIRKYLRVNISDSMCGFKFIKRKAYHKIIKNSSRTDSWFFCAEIIIIAKWMELNVYELPVAWVNDKNSRVRIFHLGILYIREIINLKHRKASIL